MATETTVYICNYPRRVYMFPASGARTLGALRYKEKVYATGNIFDAGDFLFIEIKFGVNTGWVVYKNNATKEEYFDEYPKNTGHDNLL